MSSVLLVRGPLDPESPETNGFMKKFQGNILKGHGRRNSICLFLRFEDSPEAPGKFMRWASRKITTAAKQWEEAVQYRDNPTSSAVFRQVALSRDGVKRLQTAAPQKIQESTLHLYFKKPLSDHFKTALPGFDRNDQEWTSPHALLLLADSDPRHLHLCGDECLNQLRGVCTLVSLEEGQRLPSSQSSDYPMEHFGYADGISQPQFFEGTERDGARAWVDDARACLVLSQDPNVPDEQGYMSYLAFFKFHQDVSGFRAEVARLAASLSIQLDEAYAKVVGRSRNGTPLAQPTPALNDLNNFNFNNDQVGGERALCPYHSHIRKMMPRTPGKRRFRIVRRGMTYEEPGGDRGLLFMSYQSSLKTLYTLVQTWANDEHFLENIHKSAPGLDPFLGKNGTATYYGPGGSAVFPAGKYVQFRGGAIFYVPSPALFSAFQT